jgi:HEPN domain-containing protein
MRTWVVPELGRLGMPEDKPVDRGLILFPPQGKPQVILGERAEIIASCTSLRAIEAGEAVTENDVTVNSVHPAKEPRDHGWICWATIGDHIWIAFDLRRHRDTARQHVVLASDYLATAREALAAGRLAVAIENTWSAAELVIKAEIVMLGVSQARDHGTRETWWSDFTKLGNAPGEEADSFKWLGQQRSAARYGDARLQWDPDAVVGHVEVVAGMVDRGLKRTEHLRETEERRRAGEDDPRLVVGRTYVRPPETAPEADVTADTQPMESEVESNS